MILQCTTRKQTWKHRTKQAIKQLKLQLKWELHIQLAEKSTDDQYVIPATWNLSCWIEMLISCADFSSSNHFHQPSNTADKSKLQIQDFEMDAMLQQQATTIIWHLKQSLFPLGYCLVKLNFYKWSSTKMESITGWQVVLMNCKRRFLLHVLT